jgi:hypothetical protein
MKDHNDTILFFQIVGLTYQHQKKIVNSEILNNLLLVKDCLFD